MPLSLFRRHNRACIYDEYDREHQDCKCPFYIEGKLRDAFVRASSTKTKYRAKAEALVREAERIGRWISPRKADESENPTPKTDSPGIREAMRIYLDGLQSKSGKNLQGPTVSKHRTVANRLADFAIEHKGLTLISDINFDVLDQWRNETWERIYGLEPITASNYIVRLRKLGRYFERKKWWSENFAQHMEMPEGFDTAERLPLTDDELNRFFEAARTIKLDSQTKVTNWEIETFMLLMLRGGMAIGDAALFEECDSARKLLDSDYGWLQLFGARLDLQLSFRDDGSAELERRCDRGCAGFERDV